MSSQKLVSLFSLSGVALLGAGIFLAPTPAQTQRAQDGSRSTLDSPNGTGISRTRTTAAAFDYTNPFFTPLGTNARSCATCHPVSQGMMITPDYTQKTFDNTDGLDSLFITVDGVDNPNADMSTLDARRANTTMIRTKGLIRVGFTLPASAEFTLAAVDDPYGYSSASDLSCFRRPLPATNLRFLSTLMWDGRERPSGRSIHDALASQIKDAVLTHMQGTQPPSSAIVEKIIGFETQLYTSQIYDNNAGFLNSRDIGAGPDTLIHASFFEGINNAFGQGPSHLRFDPEVFSFYEDWLRIVPSVTDTQQLYRLSIARGEKLFNTKAFTISGVAGLNDVVGKTKLKGTCSTCHSTPLVGSNSLPYLMNTGISDASRRTPDLPLYTLKNKTTGETVQTTDPGIAMTSGKWSDIGKFKVPSLRGIETQSPYMHNGFSGDVLDIVNFYNTRFSIGFTEQEKADLKAFIQTI